MISLKQAAGRLAMTQRKLLLLVEQNKVPHHGYGRRARFYWTELVRWQEEQKRGEER
jgi:excisionase family DNA binding protein